MDQDANSEDWARTATDDQFWSFQYYEHLQMISESLEESGEDPTEINILKNQWLQIHQRTMNYKTKPVTDDELENLHIVKTKILKKICANKDWMGPTFP